jgi:hypothetical protein
MSQKLRVGIACAVSAGALLFFCAARQSAGLRGLNSIRARNLDMKHFIEHSMQLYNETVQQRKDRLLKLAGGNPDHVIPFDGAQETYLWDYFPPTFNCPFKHRVGRLSDGGKVLCNWETLRHKCSTKGAIMYSIGVRGDISFEEDLVNKTTCPVYAYDPTVPGLPVAAGNIHFSRVGLGASDTEQMEGYPLKTLGTLMAANGHDHIDLLKVDCEGCEWKTFQQLVHQGTLNSVDQLLIELHFKQIKTNMAGPDSGVREVFEFFEACEAAGLLPFSWEVNHNIGYSGAVPYVIEYAFVRPTSDFMTDVKSWEEI